ncbi:uncharacterized protein FOMMEDRAFT_29588 [Fomitiporia mediterranea MF3/22]|uniref:uncharacterized protein n=1 Tax=Fomitiporia mediterranea (strain MF3/22) TaxID=694068 RepID=UPI0004408DA5|nr:uncharacterized protein FOMMEDRAFT_29588 [Fomitiporia mediterranea MF3/22]EJD00753.1 hypothetical protein FOMMEDRAFT_29588 [Fomitiporia mediterranea MF3/22]
MMLLFRSSFITVVSVCAIAIIGMRPYLHVYGVDASGSEFESVLSPTASAEIGSVSPAIASAVAPANEAQVTVPPADSSGNDNSEQGAEKAAQTNAAISCTTGIGLSLFVGSIAAVIQPLAGSGKLFSVLERCILLLAGQALNYQCYGL